ncbi:MAG TPA: DUF4142 domain-containing protein [Gemmatimonadaceae bacterium]|jgi:putative membrane protein
MRDLRVRTVVASLVSTLAVCVVAGCASAPSSRSTSAAGVLALGDNSSISVPGLSTAETDMLERMSDANILSRLCSSDSLEIEMAKTARDRSTSVGVRDYARQLIGDHSVSWRHDRMIAMRPGLSIQMMPGDTSSLMGFRLLDSLRTMVPANEFDRRFLMSQIDMHGHLLAQLQTLRRVAHDKALRDHIDALLPIVQQHLARAQGLARDAGYAAGV